MLIHTRKLERRKYGWTCHYCQFKPEVAVSTHMVLPKQGLLKHPQKLSHHPLSLKPAPDILVHRPARSVANPENAQQPDVNMPYNLSDLVKREMRRSTNDLIWPPIWMAPQTVQRRIINCGESSTVGKANVDAWQIQVYLIGGPRSCRHSAHRAPGGPGQEPSTV